MKATHTDIGSGFSAARPGLDAAVDALVDGDVLLVHDSARLGRDPAVVGVIERRVVDVGARIETVQR